MSSRVFVPLTLFCIAGSAADGGAYFAFSNFVMTALAHQPPSSCVRTMQAINVYILNPLFFIVFIGTAVALPSNRSQSVRPVPASLQRDDPHCGWLG